jgi:O-antigen/teichoic acid export membrane protein
VPLVFGKSFITAGLISAALVPSTLLTSLASFLDESLRARGAAKIGLAARAATLITLAVTGYAFGTLWGVYGVALGMAIAALVRLTALIIGSRSVLRVPLRSFAPTADDVRYLLRSATDEIEKRFPRRAAS